MAKFEAPNVFIGSTVFLLILGMMFTPLAAIAFGFAGIHVTMTHVYIGIAGFILFYIVGLSGFYGEK